MLLTLQFVITIIIMGHSKLAAPDREALHRFFDAVSGIIGEQNVSRTPEHGALQGTQGCDSYGDPFSTTGNHMPSGAVRPSEVQHVQEIVKLANIHKIPLWTVSRGKNLG